MKRLLAVLALVLLATSGCSGGSQTRTVLVDYGSDQFAAAFLNFYPKHIAVRQGDTVLFKQSWTGEAHSVTMGTFANRYAGLIEKGGFFDLFEKKGYEGLPPEPPKNIEQFEKQIPFMFAGEESSEVAQNGAQPCYLETGLPPKDPKKPCTKVQQQQPVFTGRQSFYNSGYIHYAGPSGNTFRVQIAKDATPGRYFFFCNNHGPFMSGWLTIKAKDAKIPSQTEVSRAALNEVNKALRPLTDHFKLAEQGKEPVPSDNLSDIKAAGLPTAQVGGKTVYTGKWAGFGAEHVDTAFGLDFIPRNSTARVGQKVTWMVIGGHTISFDVPKYFPIFTVGKDGTIQQNPKIGPPAGGAPKVPEAKNGIIIDDGGTWDGTHFYSSGFMQAFEKFGVFSLRFSKPGAYKYACLVHPSMVGTMTITP
jgi:plastocyanin